MHRLVPNNIFERGIFFKNVGSKHACFLYDMGSLSGMYELRLVLNQCVVGAVTSTPLNPRFFLVLSQAHPPSTLVFLVLSQAHKHTPKPSFFWCCHKHTPKPSFALIFWFLRGTLPTGSRTLSGAEGSGRWGEGAAEQAAGAEQAL